MKFSEILNILLIMTGTSIQEIANLLAYDRSYISKWVNDKALPSPSVWKEIKFKLVDFLDSKVTDLDIDRLAIEWPVIRGYAHNKTKQEALAEIFERAFAVSTERDLLNRQPQGYKPAMSLVGRDKVQESIINILTQNLYRQREDSTFYYTGNIVSCFSDDYLDINYVNIMTPNSAEIRFQIDLDRCLDNPRQALQFLNRFFLLISSLTFLKFAIYESQGPLEDTITFLQKDTFAAWGFNNEAGIPDVMFFVENPDTIDAQYRALERAFSKKSPILTLEKNYVASIIARDYISEKLQPILYMPRLYLYYGSLELREKMYQDRFINRVEYEMWGQIHQVLSRPEIKEAKIILTKSYINDTFKRGWVYKANGGLQIFGDYYKTYIEDVFSFFDRDKIVVLDNENIPNAHRLPTSIVYADGIMAYAFQFNMMAPFDTKRILYKSNNPRFTACVYNWLQAVLNIENDNFLLGDI